MKRSVVFALTPVVALLMAASGEKSERGDANSQIESSQKQAQKSLDEAKKAQETQASAAQQSAQQTSEARSRSQQRTSQAASQAASPTKQDVTARVEKAGKDQLTLEQSDGKPLQLKVNDQTQVMIDGQRSSADRLQQGAQVRASFQGSGDDRTATRIEATSAKQGSGSTGSSSMGQGSSGSSSSTSPTR